MPLLWSCKFPHQKNVENQRKQRKRTAPAAGTINVLIIEEEINERLNTVFGIWFNNHRQNTNISAKRLMQAKGGCLSARATVVKFATHIPLLFSFMIRLNTEPTSNFTCLRPFISPSSFICAQSFSLYIMSVIHFLPPCGFSSADFSILTYMCHNVAHVCWGCRTLSKPLWAAKSSILIYKG